MVENRIPGADEEEEPERQRLHRRDTPHHLKNKRINQQVLNSIQYFLFVVVGLLCCLICDICMTYILRMSFLDFHEESHTNGKINSY